MMFLIETSRESETEEERKKKVSSIAKQQLRNLYVMD